jgi:carbon storage regulator CsrA
MLVLSRKSGESIIIDGHTRIKLLAIHGKYVSLGIDAPERISVIRDELLNADRDIGRGSPERRLSPGLGR